MSSPSDHIPWSSVWALYAHHAKAFHGAFRSLARRGQLLRPDEEMELLHEFLLEHARPALATFRPERGELDSWLFVVFRRFVTGALVSRAAFRRKEALGDHGHESLAPETDRELPADLQAARTAIDALPEDERSAMRAMLQPGGSVRSVARKLAISRWRAQQLLDRGLEKINARLAPFPVETATPAIIDNLRRRLAANNEEREGDQ